MDNTHRNIVKTVLLVCLFITFIVCAFVYKMSQPRMLSVKDLVGMGIITYQEPIALETIELVQHNGQPFTNESLQGQWTLLFFGFSNCPGFCPATLAILDGVYDQLEERVRDQTQVVMVSVDPSRDTPEVLAEYMPKCNAECVGVTGDFIAIKKLSNQFHVGFQKSTSGEEDYNVDHGEQIVASHGPDPQRRR